MNLGLYVHIPFCRQKCLYCDFPSYAGAGHLYSEYVAALCRDIRGQGGIFNSSSVVDSIYIGGGTPSLLSEKDIEKVVSCIHDSFEVSSEAEISIEANPGTVDEIKLSCFIECGINRISFGVQSFCDRLLKKIGRIHNGKDAAEAIKLAKKAGFKNINIDLMYGLPGQQIGDLHQSIEIAVALNVQHLSIYGLKIEEGTPFAELEAKGVLGLPDEDEEEAMYELSTYFPPAKGFKRYEISNYCKPGFACRHNLKYWFYKPYIGVGAAAHSFVNGTRTANADNVAEYIERTMETGLARVSDELVPIQTAMAEYSFLALRTVRGLKFAEFGDQFQVDFKKEYQDELANLKSRGLLIDQQDGVRLSELGMKYGNIVFAAFLK